MHQIPEGLPGCFRKPRIMKDPPGFLRIPQDTTHGGPRSPHDPLVPTSSSGSTRSPQVPQGSLGLLSIPKVSPGVMRSPEDSPAFLGTREDL
eukprot:6145284-Pyramimonas_sp.AAC.1